MKKLTFTCLFIFLSLISGKILAQSVTTQEPVVLNHIAMYVYDLQKSTTFYDSVLRLKKIPEPFHDNKHTWYSLGAAGALHLIQGAEKNIKRDKNDHLCFRVISIEDFIKNLERLKIVYSDWPGAISKVTTRVDGVKQIYFQDPDGHWIEINNAAR